MFNLFKTNDPFTKVKKDDEENDNNSKNIVEHFSIISNNKSIWISGITLLFSIIYTLIFKNYCYKTIDNKLQYINDNKIFHLRDEHSSGNPLIDGLYFSIMNTTTVGFGEMYPRNVFTKMLAIIHNVVIFSIINFL